MCPGGWSIVPREVIDRLGTIGPAAAVVYLALAGHANGEGLCWPSIDALARKTGLCARTVQVGLRVLAGAGMIEVSRRDMGGRCLSNSYRLAYHPIGTPQQLRTAPQDLQGAPQQLHRDPADNAGGTPQQMYQELDKENYTKRTTPKKRGSAARDSVELPESLRTDRFDRLWAEWRSYRSERRLTTSTRTLRAQLSRLAEWGEDRACRSIEQSIEKGWQGLFEPANGHREATGFAADGRPLIPPDLFSDSEENP